VRSQAPGQLVVREARRIWGGAGPFTCRRVAPAHRRGRRGRRGSGLGEGAGRSPAVRVGCVGVESAACGWFLSLPWSAATDGCSGVVASCVYPSIDVGNWFSSSMIDEGERGRRFGTVGLPARTAMLYSCLLTPPAPCSCQAPSSTSIFSPTCRSWCCSSRSERFALPFLQRLRASASEITLIAVRTSALPPRGDVVAW